jgi:hypothetical protein
LAEHFLEVLASEPLDERLASFGEAKEHHAAVSLRGSAGGQAIRLKPVDHLYCSMMGEQQLVGEMADRHVGPFRSLDRQKDLILVRSEPAGAADRFAGGKEPT